MSEEKRRMAFISSLSNRRVKSLVKLRTRRERRRQHAFLVEGRVELRKALAWKSRVLTAYYCPSLCKTGAEEEWLEKMEEGVEVVELSEPVFRKVSYREHPEGLLAVLRQPSMDLSELRVGPAPLLLVVESVEKPGNLGAMLRTAEAAGTAAVMVADPSTDVFNPNVVRASLGSLFTVPVAVASGQETLRWLRERNVNVIATSPTADRLNWEVDLRGGAAIVIGSEHHGLSDLWMSAADRQVRIPMTGAVDSLNAGAAAAVALFEARRQRSVGRAAAAMASEKVKRFS